MLGKINRLVIFKVLNIAVIIAAVIICVIAASESQKHVDMDAFYIAPVINDNIYYFSLDEVESVASYIGSESFAYMSVGSGVVSAGSFDIFTRMVYTNSDYFLLSNTRFVFGGGWHRSREGERIAVINESLAWQLFGSVSVVGNEVSIYGDNYVVVGVIRQDRVTRDGACAYVPMNPMSYEQRISSLFLKTAGDKLSTSNNLSTAFLGVGRNTRDYYIADVGRFVENIALKYSILILFVGIYAAAIIVINSYRLFRSSRHSRRNLILLTGLFILDAIVISFIIQGITFEFWVPFGDGSRIDDVFKAITNSGFLPSEAYLSDGLQALADQNAQSSTAFVAGLLALLNFVFVHKNKGVVDSR